MKTIIVEITFLDRNIMDFGWGNGYVIIPKGNPLHGIHYDDLNNYINVHGGLTFSDKIDNSMELEKLGLTKEDLGSWLIGFDTCHSNDTLEEWTKERVQEETDNLLKQLQEYTNNQIL